MRETDLPSPGIGGKGHHLRRIAVNAISQLEISATGYAGGKHPAATALSAFFAACKAASDAIANAATVPTLTFTPTAKTYSIAAGVTAGPTLDLGGSGGAVTYTSATPAVATVDPVSGAVTPLTVGTSVITATLAASGTYAAATKTYTATVAA